MKRMRVVSIGAGNVATHLVTALFKKRYDIVQVWSKKIRNAKLLASKVGARHTASTKRIIHDADIYLIGLPDDHIHSVFKWLPFKASEGQVFIHHSGSVESFSKKNAVSNAVLYPLQSFQKQEAINLRSIPFFIHASNAFAESVVLQMAKKLSPEVIKLDDDQRRKLHLSAVVLNNFIHHLAYKSSAMLNAADMEFSYLHSLLDMTFARIKSGNLYATQTGPARRNDQKVIKKHLELLKGDKELQDMYKTISKSIIKTYS